MIYHCENCINKHNCPENQKQYKSLCKKIKKVIKKKKYNCFYVLKLICDYWQPDTSDSLLSCVPSNKE